MAAKKVPFNIRDFPASLHKRLKRFAKEDGRTMTWIILKAVEEYLDRQEKGRGWSNGSQGDYAIFLQNPGPPGVDGPVFKSGQEPGAAHPVKQHAGNWKERSVM